MALPKVVRTADGSPPILRKYATVAGIAPGDFVYLTSGAIALATGTNGSANILGYCIGSDVPAATDIIPKAGTDQNANGISRMGATGSTTGQTTILVLKPTDLVEVDIDGAAQYANTIVGSTVGIKGATTANMGYNETSYTALAIVQEVVTAPTGSVDGRIRVRFLDSILQG
jgi:hypothetical protein